jgi:PKD repeat protein
MNPDGSITLEVRVAASTDDAEQQADQSMYLTSSDLELVYDGGDQTVGMRFTGVAIPQGTSISDAHVQFQVDETPSGPTSLTIHGEATDDAVTFGAADSDISNRDTTDAAVSWTPEPWPNRGEAGVDQRTPNIASIIQEIVSRGGWASGNALAIIITGTGERVAESYDGESSAAPLLHVNYSTEPVASVDVSPAAATIAQGATIQLTATPKDAAGNPLSRSVTWSSGDDMIATVSSTGLVSGVAPGTVTITAASGGITGSAAIEVIFVPVASVDVEPASATIAAGATVQLTATPRDASGTPLPGRAVTWSSSDNTIAVVSADGLVTGASEGIVTITATSEGQDGTASIDVFVPPPGITPPNFKVAFIGDQGSGQDALDVLQRIADEGTDMVIHSGDLDYNDNPDEFDSNVTSVLGADYPYFVSVGNHDEAMWYGPGGYQEKLQQRLALIPDATCTGDLGVNSSCTYQGLFFILSGVGTIGSGHEANIRSALEADASDWRICSWHKNQREMQVGGKSSSVGWEAYETCLELGAIIATGHEHSYSRTKTLTSTEFQMVDPDWAEPDNLSVRPGATFVFVSGLGGASIRDQERCLPTTYPYGCNGEWANIYTTNQNAQHGALFIEFYVDGNPRKARGYFKNVFGEVIDQFTVWSGSVAPDPTNTPPMVTAGGDAGGDEGTTVNLAATFTDADVDDTHSATVDWGDASGLESGTVTEAGGAGTVGGSNVYADNGVYTVTVTVNDGRGGIASDSYAVTVTNVAPTADAGGPYAGNEGTGVSFSGSATDPGADAFTFEWDFDYIGSVFNVDGSGANPTHTYTSSGSYTAALRVTDDDGDSHLATATVDVADADPIAEFTFSPSAPLVGEVVTFTDVSTSYDGITTWQWDFDVAAGLSIDSEAQNPIHTYLSAGTYIVRLTVAEADGDVSVVEQQVVVTEEPVIQTLLYFSLSSSTTVGGLSVADEDIIAFDGAAFSLHFDGSDVGLSGARIDGFAFVGSTEILMSFSSSESVPGM